MSFANLKRQSGNLDKLSKAIEAINSSSDEKPNNFWRPEVDKAGNGMAIIRFLPASEKDGEDALPWVKIFSHGFEGPTGQWFIDNCLTTKNEKCPVCEHNSTLWNSGIEANKDVVRKQKRKLNYVSNVYIVSDPKNPENEGQVKLFRFGKKIFDKITDAMNPQPEFGEEAVNPFDLWKGANFKLKIRKVDGFQNYDKSEFDSSTPLSDDDAKLEAIWKSQYSLNELLKESEFKTYDALKDRMEKVLGLNGQTPAVKTTVEQIKEQVRENPTPAPSIEPDLSDDDDMKYFENLAMEE